jgi:hypothetical protein
MDAFGLLALEPWLDFNDTRFNPTSRCRRGLHIYLDAKNNTYEANPYQNEQASAHHVCVYCSIMLLRLIKRKNAL